MHRVQALVYLLLSAALLLSACAAPGDGSGETAAVPEETAEPLSVSFEKKYGSGLIMEPMSGRMLFSGEYASAEVEGNTYDFERSIAEDVRLAVIEAEEELLRRLAFDGSLTVRVLADYPCFSDSEAQTVYLGAEACRSWRQILATLSAIEGDYTNYGYLYAKADRLAAALGWAQDDQAQENESVFGIYPALLNLNYLCFDETYCPRRKINACKALALSLGAETEEAFLAGAAAWADERGLAFTPSGIRFAPFGRGCPLKIRTRDLEIFRKADFSGDYLVVNGFTDQDPFADVSSLLTELAKLDEKTAELKSRMGVENPPAASVMLSDSVYGFENTASLSRLRYEKGGYFIDSASPTVVGQVYASFLFALRGGGEDSAFEGWMSAAVADYFDFDGYFSYFVMQTKKFDPSLLFVMEQILGEPYDSPEDYVLFERYTFQYFGNAVDKKALAAYPELRPVFGYWFSRTYSEDVFLDCMLSPSKIPARTGQTIQELFVDFDAWLRNPADDGLTEI